MPRSASVPTRPSAQQLATNNVLPPFLPARPSPTSQKLCCSLSAAEAGPVCPFRPGCPNFPSHSTQVHGSPAEGMCRSAGLGPPPSLPSLPTPQQSRPLKVISQAQNVPFPAAGNCPCLSSLPSRNRFYARVIRDSAIRRPPCLPLPPPSSSLIHALQRRYQPAKWAEMKCSARLSGFRWQRLQWSVLRQAKLGAIGAMGM